MFFRNRKRVKGRAIYHPDLAFIHDAGFGDYSRNAAPELLRLLSQGRIRGRQLIDLACGSGIWAAIASNHRFSVTGVDSSMAMIRLARGAAPHARFHCASLHEFPLPNCDAITCIGEGLNYLLTGERPVRKLAGLFVRIAKVLPPRGLFIFDLLIKDGAPMNYRTWRDGKHWAVLVHVHEENPQRLLTREMVTFRRIHGKWRQGREVHRLQVFSRTEILQTLRQAGFSVTAARRYGKFPLPPRRLAFIARKQES